jgi:hypothetical protein
MDDYSSFVKSKVMGTARPAGTLGPGDLLGPVVSGVRGTVPATSNSSSFLTCEAVAGPRPQNGHRALRKVPSLGRERQCVFV